LLHLILPRMKSIEKLQNLLPLGYLFLVVMGILKESIFYHFIGVNILKYSSIMDILISPIATLTSHYILIIVVTIIIVFHFYLPGILYKYHHKKWVEEAFHLNKIEGELSEKVLKNHFVNSTVIILALMLLSFFQGFGISDGFMLSNRIKNNKMKYDYRLNYNTGESEEISMIGSNSVYYFYLSKGNPSVKIAPVNSIKSIELTKNKMLR
jgi:hypothetical protein